MSESVMTRAQVDELLEHARSCIAREMQRCEVTGSGGVVVNGDIVSLPPRVVDEPAEPRVWSIALWARVFMTQIVQGDEGVSDDFQYPPRLVIAFPSTETTVDMGTIGIEVLSEIVSQDPDPDELYPGVVYADNYPLEEDPHSVGKEASVTFLVRGHWTVPQVEADFDRGFPTGRLRLELRQTQQVTLGDPPELTTQTDDRTLTANHAGIAVSFSPFPSLPFYSGDDSATVRLIALSRA